MNKTQKTLAKNKIRDFVLSEIESHTSSGVSPVTGGDFPALNPDYAKFKKKKTGSAQPDLHLKNKMISSIFAINKAGGIDFKSTERTEKLKLFNHITGDTLPKREALPDDRRKGKFGTFNEDIRNGITRIIKEVRRGS